MPRRILVVDDAEDVRHWLRLTLDSRGWEVVDAESGEDGLAAFDAHGAFDVVVLDQMTPGITGLETAAALRARKYDGPVVLFSAYLSAGMGAELRRLRVTAVSKVDHAALFRVINSAGTGSAQPAPRGTST